MKQASGDAAPAASFGNGRIWAAIGYRDAFMFQLLNLMKQKCRQACPVRHQDKSRPSGRAAGVRRQVLQVQMRRTSVRLTRSCSAISFSALARVVTFAVSTTRAATSSSTSRQTCTGSHIGIMLGLLAQHYSGLCKSVSESGGLRLDLRLISESRPQWQVPHAQGHGRCHQHRHRTGQEREMKGACQRLLHMRQ